jgi:hypothetical protein
MSDLPFPPAARKRVIVYFHATRRDERHRWTMDRLLLMLELPCPVFDGEPDRTFVVGGQRKYLAISTAGAHWFIGQHPLWSEHGMIEGAMLFENLTLEDVRQVIEKFYSGRSAEGCFAPYYGRF